MAHKALPELIVKRMPKHYIKFLHELNKPSTPVHWVPEEGKWRMVNGVILPKENVPLPIIYPKQVDEGLWGGQGLVKGFVQLPETRKHYMPLPRIWFPVLKKAVVYSEILDQYMEVIVTERTLQLIDEHYGFDFYILKTPVQDFKSQLALDIRRKLLLALARKELYQNDLEKQNKIYEKYKEFVLTEEEAEWFGLSLKEAISKQLKIEAEANVPKPRKPIYRRQLIEELKAKKAAKPVEKEASKASSILQALNIFSKRN